eukprot:g1857.t1
MPMTPSLAPHRGLQMPTKLNRLTSSEYPLFNRLNPDRSTDGDADGICILGSGMPQFKAPTPLNRSDRVVSFRNIEQKDSLSIPSLLFRTTSNMSTMSEEGTSLDGDQSLRTSSETSWRGDANDSDTQLLPSVFSSNIGNTTVPSEKGEETLRSEIREGRFIKPSIVVDRRPKPVTLQRGSPPISRVLDLETASSPQISKVKTRERSTSKDSTRSSSSEKKRKRSSSQGSAGEVGCSCKRSRCRKKYCLCFSNGVACEPSCRCQDCGNTPEDGLFTGQYLRQGCRCDNSRCRKKYCICFNAGKKCSPFCKCKNCENFPTTGAKSRDFKSSASNSATTSSHREMGGNEGGLLVDTSLADAADLKSLYRSETTSEVAAPGFDKVYTDTLRRFIADFFSERGSSTTSYDESLDVSSIFYKDGDEEPFEWASVPEVIRSIKEGRESGVRPCIRLEGYFQCPAYFAPVEDDLHRLLRMSPAEKKYLQRHYEIDAKLASVAVGVRQGGDFKRLGWALQLTYYEEALCTLRKELVSNSSLRAFVFSDLEGRSFAREKLVPLLTRSSLFTTVHLVTDETDVRQLHLMSTCTHHVISNSTFHWWGAWLARTTTDVSRIVVCPDRWPGAFQGFIVPRPWHRIRSTPATARVQMSESTTTPARVDACDEGDTQMRAASLVLSFLSR